MVVPKSAGRLAHLSNRPPLPAARPGLSMVPSK